MHETEQAHGSTVGRLMGQAARRFCDRIALRHGGESWSFAAFDDIVARLAAGLSDALAPGSRVALMMRNRPDYLFLQAAIERAGLVRVPVNALATVHETRLIDEDCAPAAWFHDRQSADRVPHRDGLWRAFVDGGEAVCGPAYAALRATPLPQVPPAGPRLDDLCSINYTSGSSGRPKGVMLTHRNWAAVYRNMLIDRDVRTDDVIAHIGPLTHASGTYFVPWFLRGATNLLIDGASVEGMLEAVGRHGVTVFTCVPTVLTRMVNHPRAAGIDFSSLRMIGYGAEPIPRNTLTRALDLFGPILVQNYGLTEAMMTCATLGAGDHFDGDGNPRFGAIGRAYTFVEIVLRDRDGRPVPAGEIGEITIRSDHVMRGYWGMSEATAAVLRDGWLWSGDLARMAPDGIITLAGRSKDMLISGGFNIYPQEIEAALTSCADIVEAAVLGVPDADWGEIAVAFVALAGCSPRTSEDIIAELKPRLGIRTPKRLEILDALPKNANGKVDKNALRARRQLSPTEAS
ncbi:class I adenylate-forming enzyme family protein [Nitratireductor soli]|uniref:class I adenylate-forming enzyme family protein n=1 Tax=Nitratireductor soli TaxID=1670619 RepID=UPI00065E6F14|nr:AMP-binding protein [Nitratireductor soli]